MDIRACLFDVFGTVVDWRTSVSRELAAFAKHKGINGIDWLEFAVEWRKLYQPSMEEVRSGRRAFTILDVLHRETLEKLIARYRIKGLSDADVDHMNRAWHRLDPWPDSVPGLTKLKERYVITTLSNGNVALLTNMAKRAGLPWDLILSAELVRHYKPDPETYLMIPYLLDLRPDQVMLVAAHPNDLRHAQENGLRAAYVPRPSEWGPEGEAEEPDPSFDLVAEDLVDLAEKLGV
jgi:2-haloacid dehalogenase